MTPAERAQLRAAQRRTIKARDFPAHTCGASRHLHVIADVLATGEIPQSLKDEPEHVAVSIYAVLADLWERRAGGSK